MSEILRLWQPESNFVVIGRGSRIAEEVNLPATQAAGVPVLRRSSGGAAIVAGAGLFNVRPAAVVSASPPYAIARSCSSRSDADFLVGSSAADAKHRLARHVRSGRAGLKR